MSYVAGGSLSSSVYGCLAQEGGSAVAEEASVPTQAQSSTLPHPETLFLASIHHLAVLAQSAVLLGIYIMLLFCFLNIKCDFTAALFSACNTYNKDLVREPP